LKEAAESRTAALKLKSGKLAVHAETAQRLTEGVRGACALKNRRSTVGELWSESDERQDDL